MQEDLVTEFKSSFSEKVIETLVAFANTKGGKVLVGIDNERIHHWIGKYPDLA